MRLPRQLPIVLGVALYIGLLAMLSLGLLQGGQDVGYGGVRVRGARSDLGLLLTLLVAAPFLVWAAIASWRKKP